MNDGKKLNITKNGKKQVCFCMHFIAQIKLCSLEIPNRGSWVHYSQVARFCHLCSYVRSQTYCITPCLVIQETGK